MKCKMTTLCYIEKDGRYLMLHRVKKENDMNQDKYHEKVFAIDEDTAIDQVTDVLDKKGMPYGMCMAEEI